MVFRLKPFGDGLQPTFCHCMSPDNIDNEAVHELMSSERGRTAPHSLLHEKFQLEARTFVRKNGYKRGEPNMTDDGFRTWVYSNFGCEICNETARHWLHDLGFSQKCHKKGVYFDGHERDDVVEHRKEFVAEMNELERRCIYNGHLPVLQDGERPLIMIHHDESTFYANADQSQYWSDGSSTVLKQKSLGQSIMVSDFIEEAGGDYLRHNDDTARLLLETNTEGYFDDMLMTQVDKAIDIFEAKYLDAQALLIFDNAPSHKKYAADALNADHMNVNPGGKQVVMRDTVFEGTIQKMVRPDGRPKGMKLVLQERGVDTKGMNADKMRETLKKYDDFKNSKTILEERIERTFMLLLPQVPL